MRDRDLAGVPVGWRIRTRGDLLRDGWTRRTIAESVASGSLLRPRGGCYLARNAAASVIDACRYGGRVACVDALRHHDVFVLDAGSVSHVWLPTSASRIGRATKKQRRHWAPLIRAPHPASAGVGIIDALAQAVRCQEPRAAVASIDSALHQRLIDESDLDDLFRALPRRFRVIRALVDARAESGPETLMRLLLRGLGRRVDLQVEIDGVGRVDLLVDGWLIVECDSEKYHGTWSDRKRDLRRDRAAARLGYTTVRVLAEDIMWHRDDVLSDFARIFDARRSRATR